MERLRKKLQEQQSLLLLTSPTIPLRMHSRSSGKVSSSSSAPPPPPHPRAVIG